MSKLQILVSNQKMKQKLTRKMRMKTALKEKVTKVIYPQLQENRDSLNMK